jgi:hypothetical protein
MANRCYDHFDIITCHANHKLNGSEVFVLVHLYQLKPINSRHPGPRLRTQKRVANTRWVLDQVQTLC